MIETGRELQTRFCRQSEVVAAFSPPLTTPGIVDKTTYTEMTPHDNKTQSHVLLTCGSMLSHYRIIEKIGTGNE